jgi:hypothetical protein
MTSGHWRNNMRAICSGEIFSPTGAEDMSKSAVGGRDAHTPAPSGAYSARRKKQDEDPAASGGRAPGGLHAQHNPDRKRLGQCPEDKPAGWKQLGLAGKIPIRGHWGLVPGYPFPQGGGQPPVKGGKLGQHPPAQTLVEVGQESIGLPGPPKEPRPCQLLGETRDGQWDQGFAPDSRPSHSLMWARLAPHVGDWGWAERRKSLKGHGDTKRLTSGGGHLDRGGLSHPRKWGIPSRMHGVDGLWSHTIVFLKRPGCIATSPLRMCWLHFDLHLSESADVIYHWKAEITPFQTY